MMTKFLKAISIGVLGACMSFGFIACSQGQGSGSSSVDGSIETVQSVPQLNNQPTDNTLTITSETNTYQLTIADYDGVVTWISSMESVATVDGNGLLTLLSAGYTEIIVKDTQNGQTDSFILTVVDDRAVEILTIVGLDDTVRLGDEATQLIVTSSLGGSVDVNYTLSNPAVATISDTGLFTPVAKGVTTVTATKVGTDVKATLLVEVLGAEITAVTLDGIPNYGLLAGESYPLSAACLPENCEDFEIEYTVDNNTCAAVDDMGNLLAIAEGCFTLTAQVKGTDIKVQKALTVSELSKDREDFRFANLKDGVISKTGPVITLHNLDAKIVQYGANQALKIYTLGNGEYNYVAFDFGERKAGLYKVTLTFIVEDGMHEGAIARQGETDNFTTIWQTQANGDGSYTFAFEHENDGENAKLLFVAPNFDRVGEVVIDDISIETVEDFAVAVESAPSVDFDGLDALVSSQYVGGNTGIYFVRPRNFDAELVDDDNGGKALRINNIRDNGYSAVVWSVGDVEKGLYKLVMDIDTVGYASILQAMQANPTASKLDFTVLSEVNYSSENYWDRFFRLGRNVSGNTWEIYLSFQKAQKDFAIGFAAHDVSELTIDNLKFEKVDSYTANFEEGMDDLFLSAKYGDIAVSGTTCTSNGTYKIVKEENGNQYLQVTNTLGKNTNAYITVGYLEAGYYELSVDAEVVSGQLGAQFAIRLNTTVSNTPWNVSASLGSMLVNARKEGDRYFYTFELLQDYARVEIGFNDKGETENVTKFDNFTIRKLEKPTVVNSATGKEMTYSVNNMSVEGTTDGLSCTVSAASWSEIRFRLGDLEAGTYTFTLDASWSDTFSAHLDERLYTVGGKITTSNNGANFQTVMDLGWGQDLDSSAKIQRDGTKYTFTFTLTTAKKDVGISLGSNTNTAGATLLIRGLTFAKQ